MQRTRAHAALAVMLLAVLMALPLTADAASASINARFDISSRQVSIKGVLTLDGRGLQRERVVATLDGEPRDDETTKGNGEFSMSFDLPNDLSAGTHEVAVVFGGSSAADGARASTTFTVTGNPGDWVTADPAPSASTDKPSDKPTAQAPAASTLTATADGNAFNGGLVTLNGSLTTGSGGIGNAGISVADRGGEVDESFTVTGSDGSFTTYYSVPEDAPDGNLTLTLSFDGTSTIAAASTQVSISITHTELVSSTPSESPSASPSPSATPTSATQTATPSPSPTAVAAEPANPGGSLATGFLIAVASVGALGIITAAALVYRGVHGSGAEVDEERSLDMFDDGEPPVAPRRG